MEEIDLNQLLNYFKSKAVYIIFTMALAFSIAALYVYFLRVPEYTSSTTILLNQTNSQINNNELSLNKSLVPTYSEIIKSKRVLDQVIENMALEYEYSALYSMIKVSEVTDTSIIRISVTNEDRELAARIANEISNVFTREIVEIYNLENISVIDEAEVSQVSSNTSIIKIVLIATVAGGLLASAVVFIIFYFDTTIKNEEDIERATGLPVIGLIPMPHEKIKKSYHKKYYQDIAKKHLSDTREAVVPIDIKKDAAEENILINNLSKEDSIEDRFIEQNSNEYVKDRINVVMDEGKDNNESSSVNDFELFFNNNEDNVEISLNEDEVPTEISFDNVESGVEIALNDEEPDVVFAFKASESDVQNQEDDYEKLRQEMVKQLSNDNYNYNGNNNYNNNQPQNNNFNNNQRKKKKKKKNRVQAD